MLKLNRRVAAIKSSATLAADARATELRAAGLDVIPLAAGIMRMLRGRFWVANIASALVWAPMLLFVGDAVGETRARLIALLRLAAG